MKTLILTLFFTCLFAGQVLAVINNPDDYQQRPRAGLAAWRISAWSACSAIACGTSGVQTRSVVCVRNNNVVSDAFCPQPKPATSQACSAPACNYTYSYVVGAWSACSANACGTSGTQTRSVVCKRNDGATVVDSYCAGTKPATSQSCSAPACTYTYSYVAGAWSACSATACGTSGTQTRSVVCKRNDGATVADSNCSGTKPATSQSCSAPACTYTYSYVVGAWSACSATACGTSGTQTRSVTCKRNDGQVVIDSFCSGTKPSTSQACSAPACTGVQVPSRARGVDVVSVANFGAIPNDSGDDTLAIQDAINSLPSTGGTVTIPDGTYMIDTEKSIRLRSKMLLKLSANTVLKAIPNALDRSYVVQVLGVSDVEIQGGHILGERNQHLGTTGEWGHGMMIRGSLRVTVRDLKLSENWGDGISIGAIAATSTRPAIFADDVFIYNIVSTRNRRQGLSIGRSSNVKVYNSEFSYTQGTAPQYGIDIEPDPSTVYYSKYVIIEGCNIHHNQGGGIQGYKEVYDLIIKKNTISYNAYGIYLYQSYGGQISENTISHNRYQGLAFRNASKDFSVSENIFRNNHTALKGVTNDTNPLTAITGFNPSSSQQAPHMSSSSDAGINSILKNYYAQ